MPKTDPIRSQLRLPAGLHEAIKIAAEKSGRSMNAEIVSRLQESIEIEEAEDLSEEEIDVQLRWMDEKLREVMAVQGRILERLQPPKTRPNSTRKKRPAGG
ncbi:MAG: Arc family DNA-binding protein [Dokdonella sp.]|nr:Arc family DNA-binding protein [Dokdonella sp.]